MKKRILGLALALVMIISLLPAVTVLPVQAAAVTKTLTLWGTAVTIDNDDATAEIKDAYYWTNNGTDLPAAATASDNWNISFAIVNGEATLTLKNAEYSNAAQFITIANTYGGVLNIVFEGTNTITRSGSGGPVIASSNGNTNKPYVKFKGGESDVLNLSGNGANTWVVDFYFGNHNDATGPRVSFLGGTINITKTTSGKYGALRFASATVLIENCNLNVNTGTKANNYVCLPAVMSVPDANGDKARPMTIRNANLTITTDNIIGLLMGSCANGVLGTAFEDDLCIEGSSKVSVTVANTKAGASSARGGIIAKNIIVKGGTLEVKATTTVANATIQAITLKGEGVTAPNLTEYVGEYNMYVAEGGEPVTAYAASNYFKVAFKPCTTHAGVITDCTKNVKCTNPGCPENFYTAPANAAHEAGADDGDCTTGIKCKNCEQIVTPGQASHKDTRTDCAVAGTCANAGCTHAFTAGQHSPAADDGDCTTDIKCATCGKVATKGQAEHKYTDKNDTTCDNAGCTNTRKVEATENPKTGDNTALVLVATLMVAAAAAFVTSKKFVR